MNLRRPFSSWRPAALALLATLLPLTPTLPLASLAACSSDDGEAAPAGKPPVASLGLPAGCQPLLGGDDCFLPYPSNFHLQEDPALPTGKRVAPAGAGKLLNDKGVSADVGDWMPSDGASKTPTLLTLLGSPVSLDGLVGILDPYERSATLESPTLLIEADTGALIPHFVDIDTRDERPERQSLVLTPLVGLKEKTRYVAAIRKVKGPDGALAKTPEGFRRLRDQDNDAELAPLLARYEADVFAPLNKLAVDRAELQMAWDFSTGSDESKARDMLRVRELTLAWLQGKAPAVTVDSVEEAADDPLIWRTIRGKVQVPLFTETDKPGALLHRGADGRVEQKGEAQVDFVARVPRSLRDRFEPGRPLAFGHGFFGSREETVGGSCAQMADTLGMVFVGIDWWGMSGDDLGVVAENLAGDPSLALTFTDRLHQAMANWTAVTAAMKTVFPTLEAFRRPKQDGAPGTSKDPQGNSNADAALFDATRVHFLGISQGHILGGTLAAFDPDLDRIALNVGGASFTQMMFRARPFGSFLAILAGGMKEPFLQRKYAATMQPLFDRIDPGFWAPYVLADKLPGSPADRRVLQQAGIGDVQVPNLGSFLHARLLGLPQITPTPAPVFGLEQKAGPVDGSAFALYDFGVSPEVYREAKGAAKENPVHNDLRLRPDALDQLDQFFRADGKIVVSDKK